MLATYKEIVNFLKFAISKILLLRLLWNELLHIIQYATQLL